MSLRRNAVRAALALALAALAAAALPGGSQRGRGPRGLHADLGYDADDPDVGRSGSRPTRNPDAVRPVRPPAPRRRRRRTDHGTGTPTRSAAT